MTYKTGSTALASLPAWSPTAENTQPPVYELSSRRRPRRGRKAIVYLASPALWTAEGGIGLLEI